MEAASLSRKVRLEELRKRKDATSSTSADGNVNGNKRSNGNGRRINEYEIIQFDEEDEKMQEEGIDIEFLRNRIQNWSTSKLIHSFRILDRKQRINYSKLKDSIENMILGFQENMIAEHEEKRKEDLDLHNIAPKRPNWDLKRDLQKRLQKLERRDKEARLILIRQRIEQASKSNDSTSKEAIAAAGALTNSESIMAPVDDSDSDIESERGSD